MILRAVFPAPKGCNQQQFEDIFNANGVKFVEAMRRQGYELKSDLNYYIDIPHSDSDPNENHYIIRGHFRPRHIPEQRWVFEKVPERVIPELLRKHGRKVRILD